MKKIKGRAKLMKNSSNRPGWSKASITCADAEWDLWLLCRKRARGWTLVEWMLQIMTQTDSLSMKLGAPKAHRLRVASINIAILYTQNSFWATESFSTKTCKTKKNMMKRSLWNKNLSTAQIQLKKGLETQKALPWEPESSTLRS